MALIEFVLNLGGLRETTTMSEVDYYPEITKELEEEFRANLLAKEPNCQIFFTHNQICGNLKKGLDQIIRDNRLTCKALLKFAANAPTIKIDIFGVVIFGDHFKLIIAEIKLKSAVGLTEYSQLLGYCIASNAQYGLLVNVNAGESDDLIKIIKTQPSITHIIRLLPDERGNEQQTKLAIMHWDHDTEILTYSKLGVLPTLGKMCDDIFLSLSTNQVLDVIEGSN